MSAGRGWRPACRQDVGDELRPLRCPEGRRSSGWATKWLMRRASCQQMASPSCRNESASSESSGGYVHQLM